MNFEWNKDKDAANKRKHLIGFEDAKTVFEDEDSLEFEAFSNGEYRIIRIGKTATKYILFVVYTLRGYVIRLISARQASKSERKLYIERKLKNQSDENDDG
ncbi:hypothetical protein CEQ90_00170 [Lewinellaceae bacterium SD302]|nr:hypothetical protein CEQ90_00170 [Lewinellaceae bacterium SD302]